MLTLNEIVTSICKLHSLNIDWDCGTPLSFRKRYPFSFKYKYTI